MISHGAMDYAYKITDRDQDQDQEGIRAEWQEPCETEVLRLFLLHDLLLSFATVSCELVSFEIWSQQRIHPSNQT
ncbi:hypothetical protein V6N11_026199 [Hibiscus sabdariffa]|uniref:Uncharacterized protein n=1 Tax=Hibiscus sabdariffa TaxID=183260 RepID=A0ABR2SVM8_9ROSI